MSYETNFDRYRELTKTYRVRYITMPAFMPMPGGVAQEQLGDCDIAIQYVGAGYAHQKYRVVKNTPNLEIKDLAILCDRGNLCFGYRVEGGLICVYTD